MLKAYIYSHSWVTIFSQCKKTFDTMATNMLRFTVLLFVDMWDMFSPDNTLYKNSWRRYTDATRSLSLPWIVWVVSVNTEGSVNTRENHAAYRGVAVLVFLVNCPAITVLFFWPVLTLPCPTPPVSHCVSVYLKDSVEGLLIITLEPASFPVELPSGQSLKYAAALGRSHVLMLFPVWVRKTVAGDEACPLSILG